jgi:spectinomycin phosphotransferase
MREPPGIADDTLFAALRARYGLEPVALTFLPLGADNNSAVYRVDGAGGAGYILKLRAGAGFGPPSLAVPHYLHSQGVPHIAAPLPTTDGALWASVDAFGMSLYPLLEARTAREAGLSPQQWRDLGATLRQIHEQQLPPELQRLMPRERFTPSRRDVLAQLEPIIAGPPLADGPQRELAAFWRARQAEIAALLRRTDALAAEMQRAGLPLVLCHADLHTWNVLVERDGGLWIVDWDETILAPRERDLMFVIEGIGRGLVSPEETAHFLEGYGPAAIDRRALVYYRYAWAAQDLGSYAEEVFFSPQLSEQARGEAAQSFTDMFGPDYIIAIARESDHDPL